MNMSKIKLSYKDISLEFDQETLRYSIDTGKTKWETRADFSPHIVLQEKTKALLYFKDAKNKSHELIHTGVGEGIRSI